MIDFNNPRVNSVATELRLAPDAPQPPPSPPPAPERPRRWALIAGMVVVFMIVAAWVVTTGLRTRAKSVPEETIRTAVVERRDFVRGLRVAGTVEAVQSYIVAAPTLTGGGFSTMVILRLPKAGQRVKKGEVLVEFDRQNQIKLALDKEAEFKDLVEQINKKQAEQASARAKDDTGLHVHEDAVKSAEWETRRNEVVSKIDAEKNLANLEEARAKFKQLQETFQLKRQAAKAEMRVLEIQRDRSASAMRHAQSNAEKMEVRAPIDGVVVLNAIWKGGQSAEVQEGDEIRSGQPFLQVMDPNAMQVRSRINQADIGWLHAGQPVEVWLDAYPGLTLPGRVERVGTIGLMSGMNIKVRTFPALFVITGADAKLMPDLSASVDVELERRPNSLVIPRDALLNDAGGTYVWVKRGSSFEREAVKVAGLGETSVAVESGLREGAVVLRKGVSASGSVAVSRKQ